MKSFVCFSVILLARSVVSENIPFCASAQVKYCVLDDCLQSLSNQTTAGPQFCGKYLENDSTSIPDYIPARAPASRISSACSCLIQAQPTAKPTVQSSYAPDSVSLSVTTESFLSLETSVPTIPSAIVFSVPVSSPSTPVAGNEYTSSIIHTLSTYTTHLSGQLVTKTQSVVDSTTVYPVTHEITQSPSPKSTAPVEYTTSTVYILSSYTNPSGEVVTKTIVDYITVCPVTTKATSISQALASESTTSYETSTIYKVSTYTTLGQTLTKTLVDYSTARSITKALSPTPTPKSTIEYTISTIYSLSTRTYTSRENTFTVTDTVIDYTTVCPITEKSSPTPEPTVQYTTSTVYSLSTSTYITSGKVVTVTNTVVDYTTVCPVTQSASSTQDAASLTTFSSSSSTESVILTSASDSSIVPSSTSVSASASSTSIAVQSTKTRSRHSRTKCTKASHSTQSYPFGNSTSLYRPTGTGSSSPSSISGIAYPSSVRYPMSNSTTSDLPQGTVSSTSHQVTDSTRLQFPSGTGYSVSSTAYSMQNSTSSHVPSGSGYSTPANLTATESLPTSTSSIEINSSTSELSETTEITITSAPSTTSSPALPSVTAFCSTDDAALVFAAAGTPVTSYCSSLLSIQPTYADEQYLFVTKTTLITTTTTVSPATITVFKRTTRTDSYPFTSTYDLAQQSSACSCLSIQPAVIAETVTITVPATSLIVVSTTISACTPSSPTQAVVNGDFETSTSGSNQIPWALSSMAYVQSNVNNAFQSYAGDGFAVFYGQRSITTTISQQIDTLIPGQSYTLSYYMSVKGVFALPTASCVLSVSVGGIVVDTATITYSNIAGYRTGYSQRSVTVVPITQSAQLKIAWQCNTQVTVTADLLLDNISMVGGGRSCGVSI